MATGPSSNSRAEKFAIREQKRLQSRMQDPESDGGEGDGASSGSDASDNERAATAHYVDVGKSKLRKRGSVPLGPAYRGTRVSRAALEEGSGDDDEEEEEEEEEDQEDEGEDDGSNQRAINGRQRRPTAADFMMSDSEEDMDEEDQLEEDEDDMEDEDDEEDYSLDDEDVEDMRSSEDDSEPRGNGLIDDEAEEDSDEEEGEEEEESDGLLDEDDDELEGSDDEAPKPTKKGVKSKARAEDARAELREMYGQAQKHIVTSMSEAAKADAEKGLAVRQQRRTFDTILNLRIRLQKALVAVNSFGAVDNNNPDSDSSKEAYAAAEEAAVRLWNTIGDLRDNLLPENKAKTGEKRKRAVDSDTPSASIWEAMGATESLALLYRRKVLDKWSAKVRQPTTLAAKPRQLREAAAPASLVATLDDQLLNVDRLVRRAHVPRSCAPVQAARRVDEDAAIYEDGDFYQLLLKELVEQRSGDTSAPGAAVATIRWSAMREAKSRKVVDRKASKGRKLRYAVVHEKLQNFMVPEDRRKWEQEAIDNFFGTLFGQKMELKEDDEVLLVAAAGTEQEVDEMMMGGVVDAAETGLRLFRS